MVTCSGGSDVAADTTRLEYRSKWNTTFDGDTASFIAVYTDTARDEIKNYLNSKQAYVDPIGGLRASTSVDTINWVFRSFTGDPEN